MYNFIKTSSFTFVQGSRTLRQILRQAFCCHARPDPLMSPKHGLSYSTFGEKSEKTQEYFDEREPLTPTSDTQLCTTTEISPSTSAHDDSLCSNQVDNETNKNRQKLALNFAVSTSELLGNDGESQSFINDASIKVQTPTLVKPSLSAPAGFDSLLHNLEKESGLLFGEAGKRNYSTFSEKSSAITTATTDEDVGKVEGKGETQREEPEGCSDISASSSTELKNNFIEEEIIIPDIATDEILLQVMDKCDSPLEVLSAIGYYRGEMSPELSVACIHHVYAKTCMLHPRNSKMYNQMCGVILTDKEFRKLILVLERNIKHLTNFALLTAASDLLWLRLTLKKPTIPALISHVDVENLTLEELRLLSSCLHTPNIPLVNSEYFYNVSAAVAMQEIPNIDDLYTLLNIMKCFGRYFTNVAKRQCENKVSSFASDLWGEWPDGRPKAAHMFDAFYRMGYAPSRDLLQKASNVIVSGDIPVQPQDISAILRYCVKYGYGFQDKQLLDKLSGVIFRRLADEHASQFTTNVKWLTVFYYYNEDLFQRFVKCVSRDMHELDFVALSDALDTLAQVYYVPNDADEFFEKLHTEMINKLPTLNTSHVHNAKRKLLLTAFHFAVYGRYPEEIIRLALADSQIPGHMSHSGTRHFLVDLCRAIGIERPDLLPKNLPMHLLQNHGRPKLYAFEKDVQDVLDYAVGGPQFYHLVSSPACNFPFFLLRARLDGTILPAHDPNFIPPHRHQVVQNVAVVPLPRSRFCMSSQHAVGKTRLVLRLLRSQGARVVTIPHFNWDQKPADYKLNLLKNKIFKQKADDVVK